MGKLFYLMGKSASGKDFLYEKLLGEFSGKLSPFLLYTTRPIRDGETNGKEYYFVDEETLERIRLEGRLIEERMYNTVQGPWYYFTADYGEISLDEKNYLGIGTLESYLKIREYYGQQKVCPIYLEVEDGERLLRAIRREQKQEKQDYPEMCRRFLSDHVDFSEENLERAGITRRFQNISREECLKEVRTYIEENMDQGSVCEQIPVQTTDRASDGLQE